MFFDYILIGYGHGTVFAFDEGRIVEIETRVGRGDFERHNFARLYRSFSGNSLQWLNASSSDWLWVAAVHGDWHTSVF
jgi:hypothetical protein